MVAGTDTGGAPDALVPVVLRAPRRLLVARLVCGVAAGVLAAAAWWLLALTWLVWALAAAALVQFIGAGYVRAARVTLGAEGIRIRGLAVPRTVAWAGVWECRAARTMFGQHVRVRPGARRREVRLPVPTSPHLMPDPAFDSQFEVFRAWCARAGAASPTRSGRGSRRAYAAVLMTVLLVALLFDRPWDWSVPMDGAHARGLPDLCQIAPNPVSAVVGEQPPAHHDYLSRGDSRYLCVWGVDDEQHQMMFVAVDVFQRLGVYSGTWRAHDAFAGLSASLAGYRRHVVPPVGDESAAGNVLSHTLVVSRRANALVEVYTHGPDIDDHVADAQDIARAVVDAIRTSPGG